MITIKFDNHLGLELVLPINNKTEIEHAIRITREVVYVTGVNLTCSPDQPLKFLQRFISDYKFDFDGWLGFVERYIPDEDALEAITYYLTEINPSDLDLDDYEYHYFGYNLDNYKLFDIYCEREKIILPDCITDCIDYDAFVKFNLTIVAGHAFIK